MKVKLIAAVIAMLALAACGSSGVSYEHTTVTNNKGQTIDCYGNYRAVSCDWEHPR